MREILAGFVVLLCAVAATAQTNDLFDPAMTGNDLDGVGTAVPRAGRTSTAEDGTPGQLLGAPPSPVSSGPELDKNLFYLAMTDNDFDCLGTELTIGGQTYTVRDGAPSQLFGPTPSPFASGAPLPATLRWYAGGSCAGTTEDQCSGQLTLAVGTGQVCNKEYAAHEGRTLTYAVSQVTSGNHIYWSISFTSNHYYPGPL